MPIAAVGLTSLPHTCSPSCMVAGGREIRSKTWLWPVLSLLSVALQLWAEGLLGALGPGRLWCACSCRGLHRPLQESCVRLAFIFMFPSRVHKMLNFEREVPLVYLCQ